VWDAAIGFSKTSQRTNCSLRCPARARLRPSVATAGMSILTNPAGRFSRVLSLEVRPSTFFGMTGTSEHLYGTRPQGDRGPNLKSMPRTVRYTRSNVCITTITNYPGQEQLRMVVVLITRTSGSVVSRFNICPNCLAVGRSGNINVRFLLGGNASDLDRQDAE